MDVDEGSIRDGFSLLEEPSGHPRRAPIPGRSDKASGPRSLRDILTEPDLSQGQRRERDPEDLRRGGYRPRTWEDDARMGRASTPRSVDLGYDEDYEASGHHSHFSALPNTKAWEYRRNAGRENGDRHDRSATPGGQDGEGQAEGNTSYAQRAGRGSAGRDEGEEGIPAGQEEPAQEVELEWWQKPKSKRLPTTLMEEDDVADIPNVINSPHSDRWTIHISDSEEWFAGMSKEWMKTVWLDEKPTVLFTVFNYKYTDNDEINRHIESHVTTLVTQLTGATKFNVVPPEPEWRRGLSYRELPIVWAIRNLPEEAAWEMIRLRVISSRGVSIITHPRSLRNPHYVCGLGGFLRPDVKSTKLAVLSVLESDYMRGRLEELVRSSERMEHLPYRKRVEKVIESLDVRFMETKEDGWVGNVFILPPTDELEEWRQWAEEMRSYEYNLFLNGKGKARKAFWCAGCRGVDHEEPACPFPKSRGWKGPQAGDKMHTKYWMPEPTRGRKSGRGRGQGRGVGQRSTGPTPSTSTPAARGRGALGSAYSQTGGGRGFSSQRGGFTQRGGYEQRGGMRSEWNPRTPLGRGSWNARY